MNPARLAQNCDGLTITAIHCMRCSPLVGFAVIVPYPYVAPEHEFDFVKWKDKKYACPQCGSNDISLEVGHIPG